jgi:predicted SnoaL-like aldol condensation-catalyzing enzyme
MNNTGCVHYREDGMGPQLVAVVDILRFDGSCIMKHWDVVQELALNATNPVALF